MHEVGLLEVGPHFHRLNDLCRICNTKETNITVFTTEKGFSTVKKQSENAGDEYNWVLKEKGERIVPFFQRVEKICNAEIDLLFVNSLQNCFTLLGSSFLSPESKRILQVYNVNTWLNPELSWNLGDPRKMAGYNLNLIMRKLVLSKFDAVNVQYSQMKDYILNNTDYEKKVYTLPNYLYEEGARLGEEEEIVSFVVPGDISGEKRDYNTVIRAFEGLLLEYGDEIELHLLGRPIGKYGQEIINRCEELKEKEYNIHYSQEWIPQDEYDRFFSNGDIVISPIRPKIKVAGAQEEIYGLTKGSGFVLDCIRYAKPFIIPRDFRPPDETKTSALKYQNAQELKNRLMELINQREELRDLQEEALKNSRKFSLKHLQRYFDENIVKDML